MLQATTAEIQEQTNFVTCGFEIINDLGFFCSTHVRECFQFNDDGVETNEVSAIGRGKQTTFVLNRQAHLTLEAYISTNEFESECFLIHRLKKTATKLSVYFHRSADNRKCSWIILSGSFHEHEVSFAFLFLIVLVCGFLFPFCVICVICG